MELSSKSYPITKRMVYEAWKRVKSNRGAAGIDGQSLFDFETSLSRNLYKIWNRLASGSYFPPAVRTVGIEKKSGGIRYLGIPTVGDRVAQTVVKMYLEPILDPLFDEDSYGYRPNKSAHQAVQVTLNRCRRNDWVVEFDIKGAFDNLRHDLLLKALAKHTDCRWILLYVERWLKGSVQLETGEIVQRDIGTPQGGVVSPLLMNLFMHYAFDSWMRREIPDCSFARYADDAVVHCRSHDQAQRLINRLSDRFAECGLELHPDKTGYAYCKDSYRKGDWAKVQFTFLGFTFRPRTVVSRYGKKFVLFLPGASRDALKHMRQRIRSWHLPRQTPATLDDLSDRYNATLKGWWSYYGKFYPKAMHDLFYRFQEMLVFWARRKFKRLCRHKNRAFSWLKQQARSSPHLFIHWGLWYGATE